MSTPKPRGLRVNLHLAQLLSLINQTGINLANHPAKEILRFIDDVFSFWFKSNQRNYQLLRSHLDDKSENSKSTWLPLLILAFTVLLVFTLIGLLAIWSWRTLF